MARIKNNLSVYRCYGDGDEVPLWVLARDEKHALSIAREFGNYTLARYVLSRSPRGDRNFLQCGVVPNPAESVLH